MNTGHPQNIALETHEQNGSYSCPLKAQLQSPKWLVPEIP